MNCGELASKPPVTITPDKTVEEAAEMMVNHHVGLLVIVDKENPKRPIGVISERDIIRTIARKASLTVTVDKAGTTKNFVYVYADEPVTAAAVKMKQFNVRHVVVLDRNGELVGVISIRDLIGEKKILEILARERVPTQE
ncbi:MAG: CBS domain-containing protein [Pyrobaculum sp.]|nr:CBS domain-containing protein [Pyrobaculum sp.]